MSLEDMPMEAEFELPAQSAFLFFDDPQAFQALARDEIELHSSELEEILQAFALGGNVIDVDIKSVRCQKDEEFDGWVHVTFTDEQGDPRCSSVRKTEEREAHLRFSFDPETNVLTVFELEPEVRAPDE